MAPFTSVRNAGLALLLAALPPASAALPTPAEARAAYRSSEAVLLDRHGLPIESLRVDMDVRRLPWVALRDMSPALLGAVIEAEDQRFYQHGGVDLEAIGKAAWDNLFRTRPRGASTITMQLAAMLDPRLLPHQGKRDWSQKWDQLGSARELEKTWSKAQILEAYLNLVSYRGELKGIGAVSFALFGKIPSGLDETESLILGSLIRSPNAAPAMVQKRACALAKESGRAVTCTAIASTLSLALARPAATAGQIATPTAQLAQKLLKLPGQQLRSTIDWPLQRFASDSLHQQMLGLKDRHVGDGAVIVIDNASGDILAYVGNAGGSSVDGVTAKRQAGSTLKPFLYELAIERKLLTAASILDDSPIDISTPAGMYVPQNYDKDFKGYVSVRTSLGNSLNVPAVRTLVMLGLEPFHQRLRALHFDTLTESADYYGFALALGSAEVSLLDLSNAYRALATGGLYGGAGLLPGTRPPLQRVMDARASFIVKNILADRAARNITFGLNNQLATSYWSAVKTGTSKDMRDNWCVGFSERFTVGVWVGNFNGDAMWDVSGVTGAAPVWRDVMDFLHQDGAGHAPAVPAGLVRRDIHYLPAIEAERSEWFLNGTDSPVIELVAAARRLPKIRYPGADAIIALDPDIPEPHQRLLFQAQAGKGLNWQLDGLALADADADYAWAPRAGAHKLALVDADGKVLDTVAFQVRGTSATAGQPPLPGSGARQGNATAVTARRQHLQMYRKVTTVR